MELQNVILQKVRDVIEKKGGEVVKVDESLTIREAALRMQARRVGSVLVTDHRGRPVGVMSDRDVTVDAVAAGMDPNETSVAEIMSKIVSIDPGASLVEALSVMTHRRTRHLPVMDANGHLLGLVSIGDVTKAITEALRFEVEQLESYINGSTPRV